MAAARDRILIRHKDTGRTSKVTEPAYEKAWSKRGWEKVEDNDLADLSKEQLQDLARKAGVSGSGTKNEIAARIKDAQESGDDPEAGDTTSTEET